MGVPNRNVGEFQHGGQKVEQFDRFAHDVAALAHTRHTGDERHARDGVVERGRPFFDQAVVAGPVAVVGKEKDGGVVGVAGLVEGV
jgi:hypothetical protein